MIEEEVILVAEAKVHLMEGEKEDTQEEEVHMVEVKEEVHMEVEVQEQKVLLMEDPRLVHPAKAEEVMVALQGEVPMVEVKEEEAKKVGAELMEEDLQHQEMKDQEQIQEVQLQTGQGVFLEDREDKISSNSLIF